MNSHILENLESLLHASTLQADALVQNIQTIEKKLHDNYEKNLAHSIDCFKEILRLKGHIASNLMNEIVLGLQAVQSLSESIEAALREIAVRAQNANDPIDISTFIKMPALKKKLSQNNELLQLSSTWHKKAFKVLEEFLKFVIEFLPSSDKLNMRRYEMLTMDISDAETSVSDYPTLNLSWKYIIKLSIEYKNNIKKRLKLDSIIYNLSRGASYNFSKLVKSINSDETFQQEPSNVKQIDKISTIVRFYITHLLSIVKCYVDIILKNEYKHIIRTILYALIFIVSKLSPNCLIMAHANNSLQERILPIVNNTFAALFLNNIACEDDCYMMIFNFINLSIDAMNRENSVIPEIVETMDFTFAKIHFLQIILININDISVSLQSRLLPNPILVKDSKQTFCILRTFLDILENYSDSNLLTSTIMSVDKSMHPLQNISLDAQYLEDDLYIHILSTLCIFVNMLPTFLFIVFEYRMLESLLLSRSFIICTLIVDCWGCVSKILDSHVLYQEVMLIMEIIVGLVHTSSTRFRLKRLFKRLIAFLDVEQQLKLSKFACSYTFQTDENTAQMLSSREYTSVHIESNSANYVKLYAWINSCLEKKSMHSIDDLFSIYLLVFQSKNLMPCCIKYEDDIKYISFNIALTILKNSANCIDSIPDFSSSSTEFRKTLVMIDGVLEFMMNLQPLTLAEVLEVVDRCTPLLVKDCICYTSLCNFIDKFIELLLDTNDKQIIAIVDSMYERIFTSTRWFTKHETVAQIAGYTQHSRSLEIIHPVITQQLREPIIRFINRMPSYFDNELISEINFWQSVNDRNEHQFQFVNLRDLFNRDLISIATNIFSNSVKIDYDINKSTLKCLKGAHLINVCIRNYLAGNQKSEVSSELKLVLNDLKDNLTKFFQS
ncbi:39783_t:CDS:10 [Gigaspora margarita]|uniref:39783_t:CDS:1 n=1 Tax=Gigaspora margarita TaxID=4874 RepID=A0ABN7VBV0_GIGMA|nr:39783_t:CDS:10 [Gigaspora margarita]